MLTGSQISQLNFTYFKMHSCYLGIMRGHGNFAFNWYSLSSERLVDIKITKFYAEKVVSSARKI
jgi:hypothetical protein